MARRSPPPSTARRNAPARGPSGRRDDPRRRRLLGLGLIGALALASASLAWWWSASRPARLLERASASARAGDLAAALDAWHEINLTHLARSSTWLSEARAALALGRVAQAERTLVHASDADPTDPEPWRLRLERLRVEDRPVEAQRVGWRAYEAVAPSARREILRDLTLALLADLPEDLARSTLARWSQADPARPDPEARVALLRRVAAMPLPGDPDRAARVAELSRLLDGGPLAAREALAADLADAGEPDRGRAVLDAWPEAGRDARYWRLRGRWDLEYDHDPAAAVDALARALDDLPHDWKTRVRLARALHVVGREADARRQAEAVSRTREALEPSTLGPRLAKALEHLDDPKSPSDLAALCDRVGLARLAAAWRREAAQSRPAR